MALQALRARVEGLAPLQGRPSRDRASQLHHRPAPNTCTSLANPAGRHTAAVGGPVNTGTGFSFGRGFLAAGFRRVFGAGFGRPAARSRAAHDLEQHRLAAKAARATPTGRSNVASQWAQVFASRGALERRAGSAPGGFCRARPTHRRLQ